MLTSRFELLLGFAIELWAAGMIAGLAWAIFAMNKDLQDRYESRDRVSRVARSRSCHG
jgi:hypothetical protein